MAGSEKLRGNGMRAFVDKEREFQALGHAWSWYSIHNEQRFKTFNFFLLSIGFLVAGYATAIAGQNAKPVVAFGIAIFGAIFSFVFFWLDCRSRILMEVGRDAVRVIERDLEWQGRREENGWDSYPVDVVQADREAMVKAWFGRHGSEPTGGRGAELAAGFWSEAKQKIETPSSFKDQANILKKGFFDILAFCYESLRRFFVFFYRFLRWFFTRPTESSNRDWVTHRFLIPLLEGTSTLGFIGAAVVALFYMTEFALWIRVVGIVIAILAACKVGVEIYPILWGLGEQQNAEVEGELIVEGKEKVASELRNRNSNWRHFQYRRWAVGRNDGKQ